MEYRYIEGLRVEIRPDIAENMIAFYTPGTIDHVETTSKFDEQDNIVLTAHVFYKVPPQIVTITVGDDTAAPDGDENGGAR